MDEEILVLVAVLVVVLLFSQQPAPVVRPPLPFYRPPFYRPPMMRPPVAGNPIMRVAPPQQQPMPPSPAPSPSPSPDSPTDYQPVQGSVDAPSGDDGDITSDPGTPVNDPNYPVQRPPEHPVLGLRYFLANDRGGGTIERRLAIHMESK